MMAKAIVLTGIILILGTLGWRSRTVRSEEKTAYAAAEGTQAGELTPLAPCVHQPGQKSQFDAECGTLRVPQNWEDPDSRLMGLPVIRIPATGPNPAEPVFVLLGGPGAPNLLFAPQAWLLENHDVVIVGYRGVDGEVELACPEVSKISARYLGKGFLSAEASAELVAAAAQCARNFQKAGVDLRGFTAQGVVKDLEAARQALGYERINLWGESYGTRVAQLYAYIYPDSLHRVLLIGMNTPGHFVYDPADLDEMVQRIGGLCAADAECNGRTANLAQAMRDVNHNMPKRWLFFPIDPGSIRMLTHMMFFETPNMPMVIDAYLAAANGDPSGLAMLNMIGPFAFPFDLFRMGDFLNKGGTLDRDYYHGPESIALGESIMGAPLAEWVWPMAAEWPVEPVEPDLRQIRETDVDMLVVNGTLDFSTPPGALDEIKPYYHNAKTVLLPEFSHTGDVVNLQPEAFARLATHYYDTGAVDDSLFTYQPLGFKPKMSVVTMAKLLLGATLIVPLLLVGGVVLVVRRLRRSSSSLLNLSSLSQK